MVTIAPCLASSSSGQRAPDFQLADLSNTQHSLSDYRGKVVVIDFFSVNCSDCQISAKNDLVPLYNDYSSSDAKIQFLSIEITGASAATISSVYVDPTGITWPVLTGGNNLTNLYASGREPTVYVIDPTGKITASMPPPIDVQTLKAAIDNLLEASKTPAPTATPDNVSRTTPTPTNQNSTPTASPTPTTPATSTPTPAVATVNTPTSETPKSTATPQSQPADPTMRPVESVVSKTEQSSTTVAATSLDPNTSESSTTKSPDTQGGNGSVSTGLENCTTSLAQPVSLCTTSQKWLICSPSLPGSVVPSTVLAQASAMSAEVSALSLGGSATSCVTPTSAYGMSQNGSVANIALPASQTNSAASLPTQSVFEFSLLGLGAPMLLIAALYLMLRRV